FVSERGRVHEIRARAARQSAFVGTSDPVMSAVLARASTIPKQRSTLNVDKRALLAKRQQARCCVDAGTTLLVSQDRVFANTRCGICELLGGTFVMSPPLLPLGVATRKRLISPPRYENLSTETGMRAEEYRTATLWLCGSVSEPPSKPCWRATPSLSPLIQLE